MVKFVVFVAALVLPGCKYGPSIGDCDVACNAETGCPDGFACGEEGFCRPSGASVTCREVRDAAMDGADAPDVPDAPEMPPDANGCATQPCDILSQCGCASGSACDIDSSDNMGTACRTIFTPGNEESTCINATRCDAGFVCQFDAGSNVGICKRYCGANADCGVPRGRCVITITAGGEPIQDIPNVCSSNCDPTNTAAGGCPSGRKCGLQNIDGTNIADCSIAAPSGQGLQGADCKSGVAGDDTLCGVDHMCTTTDGGTSFQCRRICMVGDNSGCGGLSCIPFNPKVIIDVEYGICN